MKKRPVFNLRLAAWNEWLICSTVCALLGSGVGWLLLDKFGEVQGEFGPEPSPALPWLLSLHGVLAYVFVIASAMLINVHMRLGWYAHRNRVSGITLIAVSLMLTASGLLLYYATAEQLRGIASTAHWLIGLALPIALIVHLLRGKSGRRRTRGRRER